ncbi:hypothetical protein Ddye_018848 [Dipteronia dyeriana]|uniref:Uncharacterized protein n=1 Tax=Dipteronia dyeriana TaxID=168575 RepID=A0AAD9WV37_9ROSI|nr:hypothetical protein Ddye_018848 [Dipteronia dyeriana]
MKKKHKFPQGYLQAKIMHESTKNTSIVCKPANTATFRSVELEAKACSTMTAAAAASS